MSIEAFWKAFLVQSGLDEQTEYFDSFHFMNTEYWANELLRLVLIRQKKATTSSLAALEIENGGIPQNGDYSIVTDWEGIPRCVIRTTQVSIMPFKEMTFDKCALEGEGENLESWQTGHFAFLKPRVGSLVSRFPLIHLLYLRNSRSFINDSSFTCSQSGL